jgi:putative ABC transport system ATP-binding protein
MSDVHAIVMENVTRTFANGDASLTALDRVSVSVARGSRLAVVGPSGSGKTTLLNLIGALDKPTSGRIDCLGYSLGDLSRSEATQFRKNHVGLVFQDDALIPELTVYENVELPLVLLGTKPHYRKRLVSAILETLGIAEKAKRFPVLLSGGERQRVALARAVVHEPNLLLADEPTANLDAEAATRALDLIETLAEEKELTVVIATHDPRVFERLPSLLRLEYGRIVHPEVPAEPQKH